MRLLKNLALCFVLNLFLCKTAYTQPNEWGELNANEFEFFMIVTAVSVNNCVLSIDQNDFIGVFDSNNQLRGVTNLNMIGSNLRAVITVYSNRSVGEQLTYRIFDASENQSYISETSILNFQASQFEGSLNAPVEIRYTSSPSGTENCDGTITPPPVTPIPTSLNAPFAFNYQGVARDLNGEPLPDKRISLRIAILNETPNGIAKYTETHSTVTNNIGLFTLQIGRGSALSGRLDTISWGANAHFLQIELDENGGNNYQLIGTSEMVSVPYALFAQNGSRWQPNADDIIYGQGRVGVGQLNPDATTHIAGRAEDQFALTVQTSNATTALSVANNGDVAVTGNLSKGGGSFKIDHPLYPKDMYLYHSFVESPDMMNVYNGNITTNEKGLATVDLPAYFSALNRDFRYQLTVIGTFAQVIIKEKIINNQFIIQTNEPNVEVSWQVTGIRKDSFANQNRIQVEVEKKGNNRGKLLYPNFQN